jgi:hypothetical protein
VERNIVATKTDGERRASLLTTKAAAKKRTDDMRVDGSKKKGKQIIT